MANAKREGKVQTEGSKTDKVLKWSVLFAGNVEAYSKVLDVYISKAPGALSAIGSPKTLFS